MGRTAGVSFLKRAGFFFAVVSRPTLPVPMQSASVLFPSSQNGRSVIQTTNHHAVNASYVPTRHGAAALKQRAYLA
jgi:hypothetical protein